MPQSENFIWKGVLLENHSFYSILQEKGHRGIYAGLHGVFLYIQGSE